MPKTININLFSQKSVDDAIKQIDDFKKDIISKTKIFAERLAYEGVQFAKMQILSFPAVDTGELLNSIDLKAGDAFTNGATWYVYTDCPYAKYVEWGTGIVGKQNPHPNPAPGWEYDYNNHGDSGWFYMGDDGEWHWTKGMVARPFMWNTVQELSNANKVAKIAREVFGGK